MATVDTLAPAAKTKNRNTVTMKKNMLLAFLTAAFAISGTVVAEETKKEEKKESCCDKAKKAGKECTHACCVEAKKAGKVCEKCN